MPNTIEITGGEEGRPLVELESGEWGILTRVSGAIQSQVGDPVYRNGDSFALPRIRSYVLRTGSAFTHCRFRPLHSGEAITIVQE